MFLESGRVGFPDGFAVPTGAFRVELLVALLVLPQCPSKRVGKVDIVDLVVVVDEPARFGNGVGEVLGRGERVRVPCEIDVQSRHYHRAAVAAGHAGNADEPLVLGQEPVHGEASGGGEEPGDTVHLLDEGVLADDGTNEVDEEGGGIVPVTRHHSTNGLSLGRPRALVVVVDLLHCFHVLESDLKGSSDPSHTCILFVRGLCSSQEIGVELAGLVGPLDDSVREKAVLVIYA